MRHPARSFFSVFILAVLTGVGSSQCSGQAKFLANHTLDRAAGQPVAAIPSNSVSHIAVRGNELWIGTSKGLALSKDGGRTWASFAGVAGFARPGIFAVSLRGDTIWTATGYSKDVDGQSVQTGAGYTFSTDQGATWTARPQTLDAVNDSTVIYGINTVKFLPIVVNEQNVTFDIALSEGTVWIASWSSGIRRSTDRGASWQRVVLPSRLMTSIAPTDTLINYKIDPRQDNNYLGFAVYAQDNDTIWAGTAGGVNRSVDGGKSWTKFRRDNQVESILSDWVIAIAGNRVGGQTRIWTTNWPAEGAGQEYGVSVTRDGGRTWKNHLRGIKAYDFAFKDSIVYVATAEGVFRSPDAGATWQQSGDIVDQTSRERITANQFFAVGVMGDTIFCGSSEGLVKTVDGPGQPFGATWDVVRAFAPLASSTATYAYPNPFSPRTEVVRIHYSTGGAVSPVTIEVFDFGMNRIRTVVKDAVRSGDREHDDLWDGYSDARERVRNGVYFYRVTVGGNEPTWGKIMVLQ